MSFDIWYCVSAMKWAITYGYLFILATILGLIFTRFSRALALKLGVLEHPGERKIHRVPVPLLGGLGVLLAILVFIGGNFLFAHLAYRQGILSSILPSSVTPYLSGMARMLPRVLAILAGGVIIFLVGLWDDLYGMRARAKLLCQALVSLLLVYFGIKVTLFSANPFMNCVLTMFWVVAITNSFNLLDNMDGLCGGVAVVTSAIFFVISARMGEYFVASFIAVFAGAVLGFLFFNFNPARIFLGDAGSMLIGYLVATFTILGTYYKGSFPTPFPVVMPVIVLALPLYDTASVILIRLKLGKPIYIGDTNHFSHRLVKLGMSRRGSVLLIYLVTLATALPALLLPYVDMGGVAIVLLEVVLVLGVVGFLEYYAERKK